MLIIAATSLSFFGMTAASTGVAEAQAPATCTVNVNCPPYSCDPGEACLFYNSIENGLNAIFQQTVGTRISDYRSYAFQISNFGGTGANSSVKNNAAAAWNRTDRDFDIFYNSDFSCVVACQRIHPLVRVDLSSSMKNNNASGEAG